MRKILVLGYFGYNSNQLDGQTVKTRDVCRLTKEQSSGEVDYFDTEDFKYRKCSVFKMFWKVIRCDTLFYLPAHNNLKYMFPIICCLSLFFRFKIHYFVVGGWLREFIEHLPVHKCMLARIAGIHVETKRLKQELETYYQYRNVDIFPNFRYFNFTPERSSSDKLRVVFMASVQKMKGIDWIFHLADYIVAQKLEEKYSITFFGQITEEDRFYFEDNVQKYSFVEYKGALQPKEIYKTLSGYDVMLLPTHYFTEGLPGSVVDAYISGIPVIVTDWKHSREFVEDGYSGYIIPFENGEENLIEKVVYLEKNRQLLRQLQKNVLNKRKEFAPPHYCQSNNLKLCFVSRVQQSKGLDTLIHVAELLKENKLYGSVSIDFWGEKTDSFYDENMLENNLFSYKGILQPKEVLPTLKKYDALIFPTHYDGEGCPGILVEALSVGLPIIASSWKYNEEFVEDGINGFLCDTYDAAAYVSAIKKLMQDSILKSLMAEQSYLKSETFSIDKARREMDVILTRI